MNWNGENLATASCNVTFEDELKRREKNKLSRFTIFRKVTNYKNLLISLCGINSNTI